MGKRWESADALMNHRIYWGVAHFQTGPYISALFGSARLKFDLAGFHIKTVDAWKMVGRWRA